MGIVHLFTGDGKGKTTACLGVAMRSVGHGKKVIVVQFMKGRRYTGECIIQRKLKPYYEIHQFGRPQFVDLKKPKKVDKEFAQKGLEFAWKAMKRKPHLLVLDEIDVAIACKLIDINEVIKLLDKKNIPKNTTVYITGRRAHPKLYKRANLVTEIKDLKRPKKIPTRIGIEY